MAREFRFCPYCRTELVRRDVFDRVLPVCPECGFIKFNDPKVATVGLVTSADCVLLIRRAVDPARGKWALPGGFVDAGEMPDTALARELSEEVGLETHVGRFLGIYPMDTGDREPGGIVIAYHVTPVGGDLPALTRDDDVDAAAWFSADELPREIAFESSRELLELWQSGRLETESRTMAHRDSES